MLVVSGRPGTSLFNNVVSAIKELAGPSCIPIGFEVFKVSGNMTEIPIKGFFPDNRRFGWLIINTLAVTPKRIEIYDCTEEVDGIPASYTRKQIHPTLRRVNLNQSPVEHLVWSNKAMRTTKWEIKPLYILLAHELAHALRWAQGRIEIEKQDFINAITPYVGTITLPNGHEMKIGKPNDDEIVAMAVENKLLEEARSRGAKVGEIVAYGFLRNPKTGKEMLPGTHIKKGP